MGGLLIVARIMWGVRWVVVRVPWPGEEEEELGIAVLLGDDGGAGAACAARAKKKRKGVGVKKKKLVGEYMMMKVIFALCLADVRCKIK